VAARLRPRKWDLLKSCKPTCSLNVENVGEKHSKIIHGWYEQGLNDHKIGAAAFEMGVELSAGAIGRHKKNHMRPHTEITETPPVQGDPIGDLDALELILQAGASQIAGWKITPSDWFKALDAKYKLTQGSAFQATLDQLAIAEDAVDEDDEEPIE